MTKMVDTRSYYDKVSKFQFIYDKDWYMLAEDDRYGRRISPLFPKQSSVLDLGCGSSYPLPIWDHIKDNVTAYCGIDISGKRISAARKRIRQKPITAQVTFVQSDFLKYLQAAPNNEYDVVTSLHCTLSQIDKDNLPKVLEGCLRVLKPGGHAVLDFLNNNALWKPRKGPKRVSYGNRGLKKLDYRHLMTTYTAEEMQQSVTKTGFEVEDVFGIGAIECIGGVQDSLTRRQKELEKDGTEDEIRRFKDFIRKVVEIDDADYNFGHTIAVVGRKPVI